MQTYVVIRVHNAAIQARYVDIRSRTLPGKLCGKNLLHLPLSILFSNWKFSSSIKFLFSFLGKLSSGLTFEDS